MAKGPMRRTATVGVTEHGNSAVLVTVASDAELLDRRRIDLTDSDLPTHPHHHEGSWAMGRYKDSPWARDISLAEAIELVEQVRESAAQGARKHLEELAATVSMQITGIAIRICAELPPTTEERIADNRAQTFADSVMYREALAHAAEARGWSVRWYDRERVFHDAATALGHEDIDAFLLTMGRSVGPPWQAKHKLAAAAALAATNEPAPDVCVGSIKNPDVADKFKSYPEEIRRKLMQLRLLVIDVASSSPDIGELEETLKWGEPSYLAKGGSTVRIGWKESNPDYYAVYFNCNTKLVDTFTQIYSDTLSFEGNRAIVLHRDDTVPSIALEHCVSLALQYHKIKHLPLLGA